MLQFQKCIRVFTKILTKLTRRKKITANDLKHPTYVPGVDLHAYLAEIIGFT